ncbi:tetratricopeptide repeat protein [Chitinibacter sp. SCUT-21]|uniref:tetratricopeptide repeat protein n=1 Tax=Chitinibacter sp. SCUT-21 TaxID=2970891 RepID=UPI0035A59F1B
MNSLLKALRKAEQDKRERACSIAQAPHSSAELKLVEAEFLQTEVPQLDEGTAQSPAPPCPEVEPNLARAATVKERPYQREAMAINQPETSTRTERSPSRLEANKPRSMLPWLALGGVVLLSSLVAWFTWQYQQLMQNSLAPLPRVESLTHSVASEIISKVPSSDAPQASNAQGYVVEVNDGSALEGNTAQGILASPSPVPIKQAAKVMPVAGAKADEVRFEKTARDSGEPIHAAWRAYQQGDLDGAERGYQRVLAQEPRQRDALLGLAAVQVRRGNTARAAGIYQYLLQLNPQDEEVRQAQLSLEPQRFSAEQAALLQQTNPQEPPLGTSPLLLGQYYASKAQWPQAQQQFFLAWSAQPEQADLAFNLAICLDHLAQHRLAADFYQKALDLAARTSANFERTVVESRLAQLRLAGF